MAAHGARRLRKMVKNLNVILGVEAMCAAQGVEFRAPLKTSPPLQAAVRALRAHVHALENDRYLAPDLAKAAALVAEGVFSKATGVDLPVVTSFSV
jgi:histidine ammonia-lyase